MAYGTAQLASASGFLAVFAAGLALQRVKERPRAGSTSLDAAPVEERPHTRATHPHHASAAMSHAVLGFNEQLEKLAEMAIVLLVGSMLPYAVLSVALWWFIPLLFVVLRTLAVLTGLLGEPLTGDQRALISWFGIRGIGSVFYLMFAINHGVTGSVAQALIGFTLVTVTVSIVVHGVSVRPLMRWYVWRKSSDSHDAAGSSSVGDGIANWCPGPDSNRYRVAPEGF